MAAGDTAEHILDGLAAELLLHQVVGTGNGEHIPLQRTCRLVQPHPVGDGQGPLVVLDKRGPDLAVTAGGGRRRGALRRRGRRCRGRGDRCGFRCGRCLLRDRRHFTPGRRSRRSRRTGDGPFRRDDALLQGVLQGGDAVRQSLRVVGKALVAQTQQAQLGIRSLADAPGQGRGGALDGIGHIEQAAHGDLRRQFREGLAVIQAAQQGGAALRRGGQNGHVPAQVAELAQQRAHILTAPVQLVQQRQSVAPLTRQEQAHELHRLGTAGQSQRVQHAAAVHDRAGGTALVQQAERVAQRTVGHAGQQVRPIRGQVDGFGLRHLQQLLLHIVGQDALEVEPLAAGEYGGRDLLDLGGGQNKQQVGGRLLHDLQQGVEGVAGEHMHLIDDVDALLQHRRRVDGLLPQAAGVVDAAVGGGVQLRHIQQ